MAMTRRRRPIALVELPLEAISERLRLKGGLSLSRAFVDDRHRPRIVTFVIEGGDLPLAADDEVCHIVPPETVFEPTSPEPRSHFHGDWVCSKQECAR